MVRKQLIRTAPSRILVGSYTTKSGQVKNRYAPNPNSKIFRTPNGKARVISHIVN